MTRTIIVDADVVAYQCASRLEEAYEWAPGFWTWNVNYAAVQDAVDSTIMSMVEKLEADKAILCVSEPDPDKNFRRALVYPQYKVHRSTVKKPLVLLHIKEWMVEERGAVLVPGLEGDDVIGILATRNTPTEKIIVSLDKDLKTIPGQYVRTRAVVNAEGAEIIGAWDITQVSESDADAFFYRQTLSGDVTDGYPGCPGIGEGTAEKIVAGRIGKVPFNHMLQRGPRKGQTETRYHEQTMETTWDAIVSQYAAAGLGEEEALTQARCARILRASDFDFKTKKVKLWTPIK